MKNKTDSIVESKWRCGSTGQQRTAGGTREGGSISDKHWYDLVAAFMCLWRFFFFDTNRTKAKELNPERNSISVYSRKIIRKKKTKYRVSKLRSNPFHLAADCAIPPCAKKRETE